MRYVDKTMCVWWFDNKPVLIEGRQVLKKTPNHAVGNDHVRVFPENNLDVACFEILAGKPPP